MRPNYAQDAPPTEISVGGFSYSCNVDYRVWLDVLRLLKDMRPDDDTEEGRQRTLEQIVEIENLVFGGVLTDENPADVLKAISEFSKGYPSAPIRSREEQPAFSFEYDLNEIVVAIWNQHGVDLSWRRKDPFHWWEFLLLFRTLAGDHYILNLMDIRSYKGKDPDLRRRKQEYALPDHYTAAEREEYAAFSAEFDVEGENENDHD